MTIGKKERDMLEKVIEGLANRTIRTPEIIAIMRTAEMQRVLSHLEGKAAAGDRKAKQIRQDFSDLLDHLNSGGKIVDDA
jgi:hypothetical protein